MPSRRACARRAAPVDRPEFVKLKAVDHTSAAAQGAPGPSETPAGLSNSARKAQVEEKEKKHKSRRLLLDNLVDRPKLAEDVVTKKSDPTASRARPRCQLAPLLGKLSVSSARLDFQTCGTKNTRHRRGETSDDGTSSRSRSYTTVTVVRPSAIDAVMPEPGHRTDPEPRPRCA